VPEAIEILLVEDNPADADALDFLFCRGAYSTRKFDSPPRLILLDLKLPKVDGIGVLEQIKSDTRTKAIPVILLTSSKEERDVATSYKLGVNSYIQKPVNFTEFQDVVRQLGMYWLIVNSKPPASAFS
jgi:two-component system, response regulator